MNWLDLEPGDVVMPADLNISPWLVLAHGPLDTGRRWVTYARLSDGSVRTARNDGAIFSQWVQVIRGGENVNR